MESTLVVMLESAAAARSLLHALSSLEATVGPGGRSEELHVPLWSTNPEGRVVEILSRIDSWLLEAGVPSVRIQLDGSTYTLHAPPAGG